MNPDTRVCRRCIDAVEFRALATGHCFDGLEPAFLGDAAETSVSLASAVAQYAGPGPRRGRIIARNAGPGRRQEAGASSI